MWWRASIFFCPVLFLSCGPAKDSDTAVAASCDDSVRWHPDDDEDGYGDGRNVSVGCPPPPGWTTNDEDCDDSDPLLNPTTRWYVDADADGYGAPPSFTGCPAPYGYSRTQDDCDDFNPDVNPAGTETCNTLDDNCDGLTDDADPTIEGQREWYLDGDGDDQGCMDAVVVACFEPEGFASNFADCNDADATIYRGAVEDDCTDPTDYNCDGTIEYADADADGWAECVDCADADPTRNPDVVEICDGLDNDCDDAADESDAVGARTFYQDADGDGFGDASVTKTTCNQPNGYVEHGDDCDDAAPERYPGAPDRCDDDIDSDCGDAQCRE